MPSWEKKRGRRVSYCRVYAPDEVIVGGHDGSPHSDMAGTCTWAEFRRGRFQGSVLEDLGAEVLLEALKAAGGSAADRKV